MPMAELGNLIARILLSPWRMSTVKIRVGSLFHTSPLRITAIPAALGSHYRLKQGFSYAIHNPCARFTGCTQAASLCPLRETVSRCKVE
jgi:hypothetical protein